MMGQSPRRGRRLSRSAEFERVYRQGRSVSNRHLVLYSFPNESIDRPRLGLSVSRKVGGAVERNHVKRLLREAFDAVESELEGGKDVVVVARPEARDLAEREGLGGIDEALGELIGRAGLRSGSSEERDPDLTQLAQDETQEAKP
jgi:ribonuclease P protein component